MLTVKPHGVVDRPLPAVVRLSIRFLLKAWSYVPKAPGYLSQIVERWGPRLAVRPLKARLYNGLEMTCDLRDHVQRTIYFRGAYEPVESYLFKHLLRPGMILVDAGANVGQYTLIGASEVGPVGQVHAFEPVPKTFERLIAHVTKNGLHRRVRANRLALWNRQEDLRLHLASDQIGNEGAYTVGLRSNVVDTVTARGIGLDEYVTQQGLERVDFIKMDIEGAELFALRGAKMVLERWRPMIMMEISIDTCNGLGYEPAQIWELLEPYGYFMWAIGESPNSSRALKSLSDVSVANILFHTSPLPDCVKSGWSYKSALRFHRPRVPRVSMLFTVLRKSLPTANNTSRT